MAVDGTGIGNADGVLEGTYGLPGLRAIDAVDHKSRAQPPEHRRPVLTNRFKQRNEGNTSPKRRENMYGKRRGPP